MEQIIEEWELNYIDLYIRGEKWAREKLSRKSCGAAFDAVSRPNTKQMHALVDTLKAKPDTAERKEVLKRRD